MIRARLVLGLVTCCTLLSACGGSGSNGPMVESAPRETGTVSAALAKTAVLRDVKAARSVMDTSPASQSINSIYAVINRAGAEKDVKKGASMLRRQIPPLVDKFEHSYQNTEQQ